MPSVGPCTNATYIGIHLKVEKKVTVFICNALYALLHIYGILFPGILPVSII